MRKIALMGAMLGAMLLTAAPAFAQTQTPTPASGAAATSAPRASPAKVANPATVEARVSQRIIQMHQRLKITPDQQPAWDAFAQTMRDNVTSTDQAYQQRRASLATMSAPDNLRNFAQIEHDRADGIQRLAASFQTLYGGLSDAQKQTADAMFRNYGDQATAARKAPR